MALLYNTTLEEQHVKALGNHFTFKPGQIKMFQDNVAHWIATMRREQGIVSLPAEFEDPEYKESEEGKKALATAKAEGIKNYLEFHRKIVYNNQKSLKQDLEMANLKVDPATLATDGELESMRLVAKYQALKSDDEQKKVDEVKELMQQIGS